MRLFNSSIFSVKVSIFLLSSNTSSCKLSLLSLTIESTKIEFTKDSPKMPPHSNNTIKYNFEKNEIKLFDREAIKSGISYQPSIEKSLNIE